MALNEMYSAMPNSPQTTLSAGITAAATSLTVADGNKLPAAPNLLTIGQGETAEVVKYTGKSGNSITGLIRGYSGTTASIWPSGAIVYRAFTSQDHDTFKANLETHETAIGNVYTKTESNANYLGKTALAADSAKLGGSLPSAFLGATATAADSAKLGGVAATAFQQVPIWQDWTNMNLTAGSGMFTTATATGKYMIVGKTVFIKGIITITTNGTAGVSVKVTLPIAASEQFRDNISGEAITTATGAFNFSVGCSIFPKENLLLYKYDGTHPGADGRAIIFSGFYEIA